MKPYPHSSVTYRHRTGGLWFMFSQLLFARDGRDTRATFLGFYLALQGVLCIPFLFLAPVAHHSQRLTWAVLVGVPVYALLAALFLHTQVADQLRENLASDERTVTLLPVFLSVKFRGGTWEHEAEIPWSEVTRVESHRGFVRIWCRDSSIVSAPRQAFPSPEARAAFLKRAADLHAAARDSLLASIPPYGAAGPVDSVGWEVSYTLTGLERHALAQQFVGESDMLGYGVTAFGLTLGVGYMLGGAFGRGIAWMVLLPLACWLAGLLLTQWELARLPAPRSPRQLLVSGAGMRLRVGGEERLLPWTEIAAVEASERFIVIRPLAETWISIPVRALGSKERLKECHRLAQEWWKSGCGGEETTDEAADEAVEPDEANERDEEDCSPEVDYPEEEHCDDE